jgi:pimeloyl-ACP methyl ester carboxylesterase
MAQIETTQRGRRAKRRLARALAALYLAALAAAAFFVALPCLHAETLTAATGYRLAYDVYKPTSGAAPLALVFMHGKNGSNEAPAMRGLARGFADAGVAVYLPLMPWSRKWNGTAADASAALDALVAAAVRNGAAKVVIGGQSMGASFALAWRPGETPAHVAGKLLTSPGHMLDLFPPNARFWQSIMPSLNKAKAMVAEGRGGELARFEGSNTSGDKTFVEGYEMRAEVYASFHDPKLYPSVRKGLRENRLPVWWGVGLRDPAGGGGRQSFTLMPEDSRNVFAELPGDHNSIMRDALPQMTRWMKGL